MSLPEDGILISLETILLISQNEHIFYLFCFLVSLTAHWPYSKIILKLQNSDFGIGNELIQSSTLYFVDIFFTVKQKEYKSFLKE